MGSIFVIFLVELLENKWNLVGNRQTKLQKFWSWKELQSIPEILTCQALKSDKNSLSYSKRGELRSFCPFLRKKKPSFKRKKTITLVGGAWKFLDKNNDISGKGESDINDFVMTTLCYFHLLIKHCFTDRFEISIATR